MQSEILKTYFCYDVDDYGLQLMKTLKSKLEHCETVFITVIQNHRNYNK